MKLAPLFVELQSLIQNENTLNSAPKMSYLGTFKPKFEKLLSYLKSAPLNLSKCKVSHKTKKKQKKQTQKQQNKKQKKKKKIKFGTKIVLLGVVTGLEFEKGLSYLKPSILNLSKFQVI